MQYISMVSAIHGHTNGSTNKNHDHDKIRHARLTLMLRRSSNFYITLPLVILKCRLSGRHYHTLRIYQRHLMNMILPDSLPTPTATTSSRASKADPKKCRCAKMPAQTRHKSGTVASDIQASLPARRTVLHKTSTSEHPGWLRPRSVIL
jgi:hypothetical protein